MGRGILIPQIDAANIRLIRRHHCLPLHARAGVDLIGQIIFACSRITEIKHHINVQVTLLGVGFEVLHIDAEIEVAVAALGHGAAVVCIKCDQITR